MFPVLIVIFVVVFEGDDDSGYSAYSPDLPGVIAAGESRQGTESLMLEAVAEHIAALRQDGQPVPEPSEALTITRPCAGEWHAADGELDVGVAYAMHRPAESTGF